MSFMEFLNTAVSAARLGGAIIKEGFLKSREDKGIELKSYADPVTRYDKASEEAIVNFILDKYPTHSILTEESLSATGASTVKWIIDPLDGTVNFTHKIPFVAVCIGVEVEGRIVAGVIYNPILEEMYSASEGKGAYLNGKPIHVSNVADVEHCMVVTGFPYLQEGRLDTVMQSLKLIISKYEAFRRLGSAGMDLAYVACGKCEIFYVESLKPWDMAAGEILVREAGGTVTNYYGKPFDVYQKTILATNGIVHAELVKILKKVGSP